MMNLPLKTIFIFLLLQLFINQVYSQNYSCYTVSDYGLPNILFAYEEASQNWTQIGTIGNLSIESIAFDQKTGILYAFDGGTFGTINLNTAQFTSIGNAGMANGQLGSIDLNDVDGLSFDALTNTMFAVQRRFGGQLNDTLNDVLFQVDIATGNFIPNAMLNGTADYAEIPELFPLETTLFCCAYDVDDIAIDPLSGDLFALYTFDGNYNAVIKIDKFDASLIIESNAFVDEDVLFDYDLEGLTFNSSGNLLASSGNNYSFTGTDPNRFYELNYIDNAINLIGAIDPTNQAEDFESLGCFQNLFSNCRDTIIIETNSNFNYVQTANNVIISNEYLSDASRYYIAGDMIELLPNFEVIINSDFLAEIQACQ